jgi:hypothetical protein
MFYNILAAPTKITQRRNLHVDWEETGNYKPIIPSEKDGSNCQDRNENFTLLIKDFKFSRQ